MSQQEEEEKRELNSLVEKKDDSSSLIDQPLLQVEDSFMIDSSSLEQKEMDEYPWLDEELDEKAMVITHLKELEEHVKQFLEQSQLQDMLKSDSQEGQIPQSLQKKASVWTDNFDNIEDFMKLMSQSTSDIEDRLKSHDQQLNSLADLQLIIAQKDSFFMLLEHLNSKLNQETTQKQLAIEIYFKIDSCVRCKSKNRLRIYADERKVLDETFKLFKLSMTVRWAYNQIRINKLKKEEGIKYDEDIENLLKEPINEEEEVKQLKIDSKYRTKCDRLMSLQRQIEEHYQYTEYLKEALAPSFDPEVQLNIKNFSQTFMDQVCIQHKIKNIEDLQQIMQKTQQQIEQLNQVMISLQRIGKEVSWYELLKYLNLEQSNADSNQSLSDAKTANIINEFELAKSEAYKAIYYLRKGSLELNIQKLIYFMRLKILKKKDEITNKDITTAINKYIDRIHKNIQEDEKIYGNYQAEKILKPIKNALFDYENSLNLQSTIEKLKSSLSSMNSFNFKLVKQLSKENQNVVTSFQNDQSPKKVVIMFGRTGLGKSTAIQYLGGEHLERIDTSGLIHIGVKQFKDKKLERFKNSPYSKSETSFCSTVELEYERQRYLFCDTPGFGDTRGAEIDFSNTLGIFNALGNMYYNKTIIPVFFFSIDGLSAGGGRGETFRKDINQLYLKIFQNSKFEDYKSEIMFFFTRGVTHGETHQQRLQQVKSSIDNILKNDQTSDLLYKSFVEQILDQIGNEDRVFIIDPFDISERQKIYRALKNMSGIDNPKDVFQFRDHPDTTRKVKDQLQFNSQLICNSIQHSRYEIALHYLEEIRDFQLSVKKLDEAEIYLKNSVPLLQTQIDEFFNTFSSLLQFSIGQLEAEDLTHLQSLLNRLYSMEVLKDAVPHNIVMSAQQIQVKVVGIIQNIYIGQVYQTSIDDEKWRLMIEKTRVISETPVMGFMKEKHQQIYSEFLSKVEASVKEYRKTINQEYEKYFERKDHQQEEELNSASLFSLSLKASTILLESNAHAVQSSLKAVLDEIIKKIQLKVENDTWQFDHSSQENGSSSMIQRQLKDINQQHLDQVNMIIAALGIFEGKYREITEEFTKIKKVVEANLKKYMELLIKINIKLLGEANKEDALKLFDSQIQKMFSTFQFASQDMSLRIQSNQLFNGKEQLIIDSKEKIEKELYRFLDNLQTQDTIKEVTKQLENIQRMRVLVGEETCVNTIQTVRQDISKLINIIIEYMQKEKDVQNSSIKLTTEQDQIRNIIITQYWYSQLQSCFLSSFPDWISDCQFPEPIVKKEISEIFDEWTTFVSTKQLIEEECAITRNTYMLILIDYVKVDQITAFVEFLQKMVAKEGVYLKNCILDLRDKIQKATEQVKGVIAGQSKVLSLLIEDYFSKILRVLQQTNKSQTLITIEDLNHIETNVSNVVKILQLLQQLKHRFKTIYEALTNEANDYHLLQTLENEIFSCLSGESKLNGQNLFDKFHLTSQFTNAIKDMDLIKMNNAGIIADKLADMDTYLGKIGERKLSQMKFGELKYKYSSKYDLYQQIEKKAQQVLSKDSKKDGDLEKNYQDISRWLQQLEQIIKSKEVIKDVSDEQQKQKTVLDYLMKALLYHIKEIQKYIEFNQNERIFDVQVIENAKVHFIKLYKMNNYLNKFISKQVNYTEKLYVFIKQITKRIQQQRDSIKMNIFSKRNYNEGLKMLDSMIKSLDTLDMTYDDCHFKFGDSGSQARSRTNSIASLSLKIVPSSNSVFQNSQNENYKLQGTFPYQSEFKAIQDKIYDEISVLHGRIYKRDADFYDIIRKQEVSKIVDSFSEMRYQSSNYVNLTFQVKEIGKIVKQKTLNDLEVIIYEKYSVEDEDQCSEIIKQQSDKLNAIKSMKKLNLFPSSMNTELTTKIDQAQNHIKEVEKKLKEQGLEQLKEFASGSAQKKNFGFQDLCDKIYAKITGGNFVQVVQKNIFKLEALFLQIKEELDENSQQKLTSISLEIIFHISKLAIFYNNLSKNDSIEECEYNENEAIQIIESLVEMNEKLNPEFMAKSLNQQNGGSDEGDRIDFRQKLSSIFSNLIKEVIRLEQILQKTPNMGEELRIFIILQNVDRIINLLNVKLDKVLTEEDFSKLQAPPGDWQFKDLIYSKTNLSSLNTVQKRFQVQLKDMLDQILSYQPLKQQYSQEEIKDYAKAYEQIKEAENILGAEFIVNDKLKLGNLRENSELHLSNFINEKIEEIKDRSQKVKNHLRDDKFDENLKYLFPITLKQKGSLNFENSKIARDLDLLLNFSENFPTLFSYDDYDTQNGEIIIEIQTQLMIITEYESQVRDIGEDSFYASTLLKLSYLLYQYYPIQSDDIQNQFLQIIQQQLEDAQLQSKVASKLQELSSDSPLALIAIRLGFKDWEIDDITNQTFINHDEDQDQLLNAYEFHRNIWDSQGMIYSIKFEALSILENFKDLTFELFKMDLQQQQGIDKLNPKWTIDQSSESLNNVIKLFNFLSKTVPQLFPTKLQLMSALSFVGFSRIPAEFIENSQESFINEVELQTDGIQSHLQSTLFQMMPGQGVTTSLQILALLLSIHGFEVTLVVRGDPNASRQPLEDIINELDCPIDIKTLDQVLQEGKVHVDNNQDSMSSIVLNNRVLIIEQFDQLLDIAENKTETYEIIKDANLDDMLNLLWQVKDYHFEQEYLLNEISYISLLDKFNFQQKEELDKAISEILFDMRTCEEVDAQNSNGSGYREYFFKLKQKPQKQQVIKDFEIKLKIKEIKNNELLTSHFSCILGTYSTHLNFEKEIMIKSQFKIRHIINLKQDYHAGQNKEEKIIKIQDESSDYGTEMKKLIKISDAAILIVDNKEDLQEIGDLKDRLKYLNHSESVIVRQQSILVVTIDQIDNILTLIRDKKLKFLLKAGSNIVLIRTSFFNDPYYQPNFLHQRIDQVFKDFTLQKYLLLRESELKESLQDIDLTMKVVQKNKIIKTIDRILPRWTVDWMNICKINFVIDNPTKEFMKTDIIPTLQQVICSSEHSFVKVTISYRTESRPKLIQTGWESDFRSLQAAINQLNLSSEVRALSNSQNEMIEQFKNVLYQVKNNLERSSTILSDTQIVLIYQNSKTNFNDHELSQKLQDDKYKVSVIKKEENPSKFEKSSLAGKSVYEESKNDDKTGRSGNLFVKIAKSINFKVNSMATPGGGFQSGATPGGPQPNIQQNKQSKVPIRNDFPMQEENDFMSMVARSSIGSFQRPSQKVQQKDFQPQPKEMMKANNQIEMKNSQQKEEEKKMPESKPIMMMSSFDRERKIKEVKSKIDIINEKVCRLSNDKYYYKNVKSLFEKLLEILELGIDHINIYDRENAILTNLPQGIQILETIGFKEDPYNIQNLILISQYSDKQLIQVTAQDIRDAHKKIGLQFDRR